jgi:hypothetical protein
MKTTTHQPLDIAIAYFNAWTNKDYIGAAALLCDNPVFETPINLYSSKDAFMQAVAMTSELIEKIDMLASLGNDKECILLYDLNMPSLGKLRIAEHFIIQHEKIVMIRHA